MSADGPSPKASEAPTGVSRAASAWWAALLVLAACSYLFGLDGQHIPRVGDELPYAQVTRVTATSGQWLPLRAEDPALANTKPPLLFWAGMLATRCGQDWELWRLRLPIVLTTFLTALLVFGLGRRLAGTSLGLLSAVVFLGFFSTFRYGRPFLTNLPETLFVFLPFALAVAKPARLERWGFWLLATLSLGLACWVKSFALVAPVGLAYAWWLLSLRGWRLGEFLRRDAGHLALLGLGGLGLFFLWPLVDPDGQAVLDQFVGRENLGKIGSEGNYFVELVAGRHSVWRTWFGHLVNAGLYAPLLVCLALHAWRRRRALSPPEKALWILVLSFLMAYTIPAHRQENYLIPSTPALAVLLALSWPTFSRHAWRLSGAVVTVAGAVAIGFLLLVVVKGGYLGWSDWSPLALAVPVGALLVGLVALVRWRLAPYAFPLAVVLAHLSIACVTQPFEGPKGRFDATAQAVIDDEPFWVPSNFRSTEEAYRFLLPGSEPRPYDVAQPPPWGPGTIGVLDLTPAVLQVAPGTPVERALDALRWLHDRGRRLTLNTRLDAADLKALLLDGRAEVLVREEVLVVPENRLDRPR